MAGHCSGHQRSLTALYQRWSCADSRVVRIHPLRFLAGCHTRRLNQALSVLSFSLEFFLSVVLLTWAPFCIALCCLFCSSVVVVRLSVPVQVLNGTLNPTHSLTHFTSGHVWAFVTRECTTVDVCSHIDWYYMFLLLADISHKDNTVLGADKVEIRTTNVVRQLTWAIIDKMPIIATNPDTCSALKPITWPTDTNKCPTDW